MLMDKCIFCKIVNKKVPANIVYEDKDVIAFLDIRPVNLGHTLVIPKKHHPSIVESPDDIVKKVFIAVKNLMTPVKNASGAEYVALSVVGTEVPHLHVHIVPRSKKDGLAGFWPTKDSIESERVKMAEQIKKEISKI
jgi:histidine triad (HIT) family protein